MIKQLVIMALAASAAFVQAQSLIGIERSALGSGRPGTQGFEQAVPVLENESFFKNDIFHAPQYMPYYPTAAVIYPRVVDVKCVIDKNVAKCDSYNWKPDVGRAEYLFFTPVISEPEAPKVVEKIVYVPGPVILKEVPIKPKKE